VDFVCKEAWGFHGGPYSLQSLLGIAPYQKVEDEVLVIS
jgi:hypothetical protein